MMIVLVIVSVFIAACSQMLLKKAANKIYPSFVRQYLNVWVISGYVILALTLFINVFAMSKGVKAKEVASIESLSYFFVPCMGYLFYKETISIRQWIAITMIIIGILIFLM